MSEGNETDKYRVLTASVIVDDVIGIRWQVTSRTAYFSRYIFITDDADFVPIVSW